MTCAADLASSAIWDRDTKSGRLACSTDDDFMHTSPYIVAPFQAHLPRFR